MRPQKFSSNLTNCEFFTPSEEFLGCVISKDRVMMDKTKVKMMDKTKVEVLFFFFD